MNTHNTKKITDNFLDIRSLGGFKDEGMVGSRAQQELLFLNGDYENLRLGILLSRYSN